ncbi:Hsp20/alpha crystallin family protein [Mesonia maritima]|uniref:HSP20 family protein n=1 Tax=Mesonia maritima TaxID=1793873 RepID=A0ABU1KAC7_9FLAO|nr:Hsp20/alpha crystallin family protein [Mesonia maritima]MDR6301543.1 HSP20 family protein [Mesonia maritima]
MSLVKFNQRKFPWQKEGITSWFDIDNFFGQDFFSKNESLPAMNIKENDNSFEIELAVPGFSRNEIEVSLENNNLHISATKEHEEKEQKEDYTYKEFTYNSFNRQFHLPPSVNQEQEIKATYKNGVLKLDLAKKEEAIKPPKKTIKIS